MKSIFCPACHFEDYIFSYQVFKSEIISQKNENDHFTMVMLHREGRKKFGLSSKPNCSVTVNAKKGFLVKMVRNALKS